MKQAEFGTSDPISTNYTTSFAGTSAAAPVVSGVIALMLQAKPELTWRDVQYILIETAHKNPGWDGTPNTAGYEHSNRYGFGRVDATAAVKKALDWIPLPEKG